MAEKKMTGKVKSISADGREGKITSDDEYLDGEDIYIVWWSIKGASRDDYKGLDEVLKVGQKISFTYSPRNPVGQKVTNIVAE